MRNKKVGICFSKKLEGDEPLAHIGSKLPVYLRLLGLCQREGWEVYVLTRKTYEGKGMFGGGWWFKWGKFELVNEAIQIDLVYDRSGGVKFPVEGDESLMVVNRRDFKLLAWNKWLAYEEIGEHMPKTFWVGDKSNLEKVLPGIKTDWVVLKPFNGLKGIGIFVGPKEEAEKFVFDEKYPEYVAQEFVDTSKGIPGIIEGYHDLRVAIVNRKPVWSHVRVPPKGSYKANVAEGGVLTEIDYELVPEEVKQVVSKITDKFYEKFDNPTYSLDFGWEDGQPKIFEINDKIGFPRWEMKNREVFLKELVESFKLKLS